MGYKKTKHDDKVWSVKSNTFTNPLPTCSLLKKNHWGRVMGNIIATYTSVDNSCRLAYNMDPD